MNAQSRTGLFYREVNRIDYNHGTVETFRAACTWGARPDGQPYVKVLQWGELLCVRPIAEDEADYLGLGINTPR